jgi:hypothetical protein
MFEVGNHFGKGRPKKVLTKPELLLPAVLAHRNLNWMTDLIYLYRRMKERELDVKEKAHLQLILALMPYLVTKVAIKDYDKTSAGTPGGSAKMAEETAKLLKQLENEAP